MVPSSEPAGRIVWHVPVIVSGAVLRLRLFRMRDGRRCAVGFSSARALTALLGPDQATAVLSEHALRTLVAPLGVAALVLDPRMVAPSAAAPATPAGPTGPTGPATVQLQSN